MRLLTSNDIHYKQTDQNRNENLILNIKSPEKLQPKPVSELHLALLFALVFAVIGLYPLIAGQSARIWSIAIAAAFLLAGFLKPALLRPLNLLWFRLGLLLHAVISPVIMALIYYGTFLPTNLALKIFRKDPMQRKFDPDRESYWIRRDPPGPEHDSFKNQF